MGGQRHAPAAFTPGKDPVPIVQEAGWASEPVWIVSPPPEFDPRTFQSVASRYTDYAILTELHLPAVKTLHFAHTTVFMRFMQFS